MNYKCDLCSPRKRKENKATRERERERLSRPQSLVMDAINNVKVYSLPHLPQSIMFSQ